MAAEIERVDADRLLNTSVDDLAQFFADKFRFCRIKQFLDLKRVDFIEVNLPKFA